MTGILRAEAEVKRLTDALAKIVRETRCNECGNSVLPTWEHCTWCGNDLHDGREGLSPKPFFPDAPARQDAQAPTTAGDFNPLRDYGRGYGDVPPAEPAAPAPSGVAPHPGSRADCLANANWLELHHYFPAVQQVLRNAAQTIEAHEAALTEARAANDVTLLRLAEALAARDAATDALRRMREPVRNTLGGVMTHEDAEGALGAAISCEKDLPFRALLERVRAFVMQQNSALNAARAEVARLRAEGAALLGEWGFTTDSTPPAPAAAREADLRESAEQERRILLAHYNVTETQEPQMENLRDLRLGGAQEAIRAAMLAVEGLGADPRLTDAVMFLEHARMRLQHWIAGAYLEPLNVVIAKSALDELRTPLPGLRHAIDALNRWAGDDTDADGRGFLRDEIARLEKEMR